jgi:uncharacterized membrane-anchored protein YhcB (DUF1043 family)
MEFLKNRQSTIIENSILSDLNINVRLPAVLNNNKLRSILKKEKKEIEKLKTELQNNITNIISNPDRHDPVYKSLKTIFSSKNSHVLTRDMEIKHKIKRLAWRRFMLGYPPRKNDDTSIGDALNWEWFLHCCKELTGEFIIVSRDKDYGKKFNDLTFLNDALKSEFRDRVGNNKITYTEKLSTALKHFEIVITSDEEESENIQIISLAPIPTDLQGVVTSNFNRYPELIDAIRKSQIDLRAFETSGARTLIKNLEAKQKMTTDIMKKLQNIKKL